jgi:hypothetical protein
MKGRKSTDYEVLHYVIFFFALLLPISYFQIFSSAPCFQTSSIYLNYIYSARKKKHKKTTINHRISYSRSIDPEFRHRDLPCCLSYNALRNSKYRFLTRYVTYMIQRRGWYWQPAACIGYTTLQLTHANCKFELTDFGYFGILLYTFLTKFNKNF